MLADENALLSICVRLPVGAQLQRRPTSTSYSMRTALAQPVALQTVNFKAPCQPYKASGLRLRALLPQAGSASPEASIWPLPALRPPARTRSVQGLKPSLPGLEASAV